MMALLIVDSEKTPFADLSVRPQVFRCSTFWQTIKLLAG